MKADGIMQSWFAARKRVVVRISTYCIFKPTDLETMAPMGWNPKASSR